MKTARNLFILGKSMIMEDAESRKFNFKGLPLYRPMFTPESCQQAHDLKTREEDVFLVTYPRTGTNWVTNVMLGLRFGPKSLQDGKYADPSQISNVFPFLEMQFDHVFPRVEKLESPRFLKTHLSTETAPKEISERKRKVLVIVRNPKDTAISFYHFHSGIPPMKPMVPAEMGDEYYNQFMEGNILYGSWWEWTKNWMDYAKSNPESTLLIHYEDLQENFNDNAEKISKFLGLNTSKDDISLLAELCSVGQMKTRYGGKSSLVREGAKKGWQKAMSDEVAAKFDEKTKQCMNAEIVEKFI